MSHTRFSSLLKEMQDIHDRKNAGYAGEGNPDPWANFRMSTMFGVTPLVGCIVRMSDKFIRIGNLIKNSNNEKVGESLKDTLLDLSIYSLIAICLLEEQENK